MTDLAKLTATVAKLERDVASVAQSLKQLVKVGETLNENLAQFGRMMKERQEQDGSE